LLNSLVLIFARDKISEEIGSKRGINMHVVCDYRDNYSPVLSDLRLSDFPIYGRRLQNIQKEMETWRPESLRQIVSRPYKDPLTFYAFWFSIFVGVVSVLALGGVLATAYAAFKALHLPSP
jgi:hypothetical protein